VVFTLLVPAGCGQARSQRAGACTTVFQPGSSWASIGSALSSAGASVCLDAGSYPEGTLADVAPSRPSTLRAAPGALVTVEGLQIVGNDPASSNLTIEDLHFSDRVAVREYGSHIAFRHNTVDGSGREIGAFEVIGSAAVGASYISFEDNLMEHLECGASCQAPVGACGTFLGNVSHITFSHNVCGPYISAHYTQAGGIRHLDEQYNTFLGPSARYRTKTPGDEEGTHQNVLQVFHSSEYVTFSNNVVRNTGANGNSILLENTPEPGGGLASYKHTVFENNLFERDADGQGPGFCPQEGLIFRYNTEVISIPEASFAGTVFSEQSSAAETSGCTAGRDYRIQHNLFVEIPCTHIVPGFVEGGVKREGQPCTGRASADLVYGGSGPGLACSRSCHVDHNVSSDRSAAVPGSTHSIPDWAPGNPKGWARRFTQTEMGPYGLRSHAWKAKRLPFPAGYRGGGGAPAGVGAPP